MSTIISGIVDVGSTVNNGNLKKRLPADSSELTRQLRIASGFRPYAQGGPFGYYLPKYRSFPDAGMAKDYALGFRFGPIIDRNTTRIPPGVEGGSVSTPFVADFTGAAASISLPIYEFGDSLDYDIQSSSVYVQLTNIPTGSGNPGGTALTRVKNIIIEFSGAPNIQTGTFSGPAVPSAEGVYLGNSWQYVFGTGVVIPTFEGAVFSFQMASTTPNITAIYVDLIV